MKSIGRFLIIASALIQIIGMGGCKKSSKIEDAYQNGFNIGKTSGYQTGYNEGYIVGYSNGKNEVLTNNNIYRQNTPSYNSQGYPTTNSYSDQSNEDDRIIECPACHGTGMSPENAAKDPLEIDLLSAGDKCPVCNGNKRERVSVIRKLWPIYISMKNHGY